MALLPSDKLDTWWVKGLLHTASFCDLKEIVTEKIAGLSGLSLGKLFKCLKVLLSSDQALYENIHHERVQPSYILDVWQPLYPWDEYIWCKMVTYQHQNKIPCEEAEM